MICSGSTLVIASPRTACVAWGIDNGVTAKIDQLGPEHVVLLKGAIAGSCQPDAWSCPCR